MATHVKVLAILNVISGVLGLFGALILVLVFGIAGLGAAGSGDPIALPIIGLTGAALVLFVLGTSLPAIIVGYGLYNFRPWARIFGIIISILALFAFPIGTALGVYGLWVLFSREGARLFEPRAVA